MAPTNFTTIKYRAVAIAEATLDIGAQPSSPKSCQDTAGASMRRVIRARSNLGQARSRHWLLFVPKSSMTSWFTSSQRLSSPLAHFLRTSIAELESGYSGNTPDNQSLDVLGTLTFGLEPPLGFVFFLWLVVFLFSATPVSPWFQAQLALVCNAARISGSWTHAESLLSIHFRDRF